MKHKVATLDDLWVGELVAASAGDVRVVVANVEGEVVAFEDACAHQRFPLSRGRLCGRVLTCAAHGWEYDCSTGEGINPRRARLKRLRVRIDGRDVFVDTGEENT